LARLGAELINTWLADTEVAGILARYDVLVASHIAASQSGVVALALGHGMPVVATPVGGLKEAIVHERTGLIADAVDGPALAQQIARLVESPSLYRQLVRGILSSRESRSMDAFVRALIEQLTAARLGTREWRKLQLARSQWSPSVWSGHASQ